MIFLFSVAEESLDFRRTDRIGTYKGQEVIQGVEQRTS